MRKLITALALVFVLPALAAADELQQAYQKEYAYLVAEKNALEQRLRELRQTQAARLRDASAEIERLQSEFVARQNRTDRLNRLIVEASRTAESAEAGDLLLDTTLLQARASLEKLSIAIDAARPAQAQLASAFEQAGVVMAGDGSVRRSQGRFFLFDGEAVDGEIFQVGRIARYGDSAGGGGALAPAGAGLFKVWNGQTRASAQQLLEGLYPKQIEVFLYDNDRQRVERPAQKTLEQEVEASGPVGLVILGLGAAGLLLVVLRVSQLLLASANLQSIARKVNQRIEQGDLSGALDLCKKRLSAASRVIAATLRNLDRDRDHIEDIISETILHESSRIDRFGAAILVIAAISPLLGLLGTVTGMISTFDIITEFGTGDPKLLSSGISEALLTTQFGLIVAIPLLLIGNVLSSWGQRIKSELEQAALHMINTHKY